MDNVSVLDKAAAIAKQSLTKIEAPAKAKVTEEAKVASDAKAKADADIKKDEGIKLQEQETKAKEDERILTVDDKQLSEPELARKAELKETKRKKDESPDEKIKRVQESSQKRIDEIKSELLSEREHTKQEMEALKAELVELKKPRQQEDALAKSKREESERIARYVEEDKTKPKEQRREMSKEDLETWYLEDPLSATEWIQDRTQRRSEERNKKEEKPVIDNTEEKKKLAKEFFDKQNISKAKLISEFPGLVPTKEKIVEIRTALGLPLDRGLNQTEIDAFNKVLSAENEEYRVCIEITKSDPKYLEQVNGPEMVLAEMKKRFKKPESKIEITQDELNTRVEAEIARRKLVDGEGISSTNGGKKVDDKVKNKTALEQRQLEIAKKAKMTPEQLDKVISRRQSIPGAGSFSLNEEDK